MTMGQYYYSMVIIILLILIYKLFRNQIGGHFFGPTSHLESIVLIACGTGQLFIEKIFIDPSILLSIRDVAYSQRQELPISN